MSLKNDYIYRIFYSIPLPQGYWIGYRSHVPFVEVKLFGPKDDSKANKFIELIYEYISKWTIRVDKSMLEELSERVSREKLTFSLIETCTSGWLVNYLSENRILNDAMRSASVFGKSMTDNRSDEEPLFLALVWVKVARRKVPTDVTIVTVPVRSAQPFAVALSTKERIWGRIFEWRRTLLMEEEKRLIGTTAVDMFLRYVT